MYLRNEFYKTDLVFNHKLMKMNILKTFNWKSIATSLAIIVGFACIVLLYFNPIFDGKTLQQHDVLQFQGMAKEALDYEEQTGEPQLWTNSMYGGMPTYLIRITTHNATQYIHKFFHTNFQHPQMLAIMYLVCFFLALLLIDVPIWLAMLGALFYGFSTYFYIIIEAGHITKAAALGYMPLIIAAIYATYMQGKTLLGASVFSLVLSLQLIVNHLQITYYTALICAVLVCFALYEAIKAKAIFKNFIKPSLFLLAGLILAVGANCCNLYMTYDYGKDSMRGKSELTDTEDKKTGGLDKDYATAWSYGIAETIDLLVPNFMGGASMGELDEDSETFKTLKANGVPNSKKIIKSMPTYWGEQPITSGPVYIGAIVIFLFIFGLLYVEGTTKWWLALVSLFSILLAWGHNFMPLTDLFLDYFPGYNKFRTVSMILVVAEFAMPMLAILALKKFFEDEQKELAFKKLAIALGITGGFLLLLIFTSGLWSFAGTHDSEMLPEWLLPSLIADRKAMMSSDLWRTLLLVIITFVILALVRFQKLKQIPAICLLAALVMVDMIPVNKRFLNNDDFVKPAKDYFKANAANKTILADKDPNFRVMNFTVSPFNDASTSYFHKSIGGYHGAKMKRYQELIDSCLAKRNFDVYNMLNTKYFIVPGENQQPVAQRNPEALGNAWFVESVHMVPNADTEIQSLKDFNPAKEAFVDMRFTVNNRDLQVDSSASITLNSYAPMDLVYTSSNTHDGVAIFSEIFYDKGWNAYIDGEKVPYFRANYVLRGLEIPAGQHQIEFKFEPQTYYTCNRISLVSSVILLLGFLAVVIWEIRKKLVASEA